MVTGNLSSAGAGVKSVVESLSRALSVAEHEVCVFGIVDHAWRNGEDSTWTGAATAVLPGYGPISYAPKMLRQLIGWKPDVVHRHGLWMHHSRTVRQWQLRTGRPSLVSVHGMLAEDALRFSPLKKRVVGALYERCSLRDAGCLHATCESEAREIGLSGFHQPTAVISNGVDLPLGVEICREKRKSVLSLGRVHPKKGLDRLIRAWATLEQDFSDWSLEIVGPDERGHAGELRRLADSLGIKRIVIEGPVYGIDKIHRLSASELFVLPTRNDNFAMTVAESLACGTPVISTKGAPWSGLVDNRCGWWIDQDEEAITGALCTAMSLSREERAAMGARGRAWMERDFRWDRVAAQMAVVYRWLVSGEDPPPCVRMASS